MLFALMAISQDDITSEVHGLISSLFTFWGEITFSESVLLWLMMRIVVPLVNADMEKLLLILSLSCGVATT